MSRLGDDSRLPIAPRSPCTCPAAACWPSCPMQSRFVHSLAPCAACTFVWRHGATTPRWGWGRRREDTSRPPWTAARPWRAATPSRGSRPTWNLPSRWGRGRAFRSRADQRCPRSQSWPLRSCQRTWRCSTCVTPSPHRVSSASEGRCSRRGAGAGFHWVLADATLNPKPKP